MVEKEPRFNSAAGAKFDNQAMRTQAVRHFGDVGLKDPQFRAGEVILVQIAYLIEEPRAALIVKIFARQRFGRLLKPL
jgi:hypothetical protein